MVRQYWEQGTHILLVDTGNSYKGLCDLIHQKTGGDDWVYVTYQEDDPISFNPFFTQDYRYDIEKRDSIKTLILTDVYKRQALCMFWNMVDRRERTVLYDIYQQGFSLLGLDLSLIHI